MQRKRQDMNWTRLEKYNSNPPKCLGGNALGTSVSKCDPTVKKQNLAILDRTSLEGPFRISSEPGIITGSMPMHCFYTNGKTANTTDAYCKNAANEQFKVININSRTGKFQIESVHLPGQCISDQVSTLTLGAAMRPCTETATTFWKDSTL